MDTKQYYVKPQWIQELPPFCVNLTGISNEIIQKEGLPLEQVLSQVLKLFDH
jgi:hypothetical protein